MIQLVSLAFNCPFVFMVVLKLLILWFSLSQGILVLDSNMQIAAGNNKIKLYNQS